MSLTTCMHSAYDNGVPNSVMASRLNYATSLYYTTTHTTNKHLNRQTTLISVGDLEEGAVLQCFHLIPFFVFNIMVNGLEG